MISFTKLSLIGLLFAIVAGPACAFDFKGIRIGSKADAALAKKFHAHREFASPADHLVRWTGESSVGGNHATVTYSTDAKSVIQAISVRFSRESCDNALKLATAKYGAPADTAVIKTQDYFGNPVPTSIWTWVDRDGSETTLYRPSTGPYCDFIYQSQPLMDERKKKTEAAARDF